MEVDRSRFSICEQIGRSYLVSNIENGEFSYATALKKIGKDIKHYKIQHKFIDLRFENERLVILVETKKKFTEHNKRDIQNQLKDYVTLEKAYSGKKIVAILAETEGNDIWVWYGKSVIIDDDHKSEETTLRKFAEYEDLCFGKVNDKIKVVDSIKVLNEKLHSYGINEKLRSQFVGTCLLALKNGLVYKNVKKTIDYSGVELTENQVILNNIQQILSGLLQHGGGLNKAEKIEILTRKVLEDQDVTSLTYDELKYILQFIDENVVPYINDKNTAGQDLLNLFFTTFNKYVGKSDKNQAFTPDHICDFMSKAVGVNKNSRVLDPCCGSGAFLVRAMTDAMDDCDTEKEREAVKQNQIYGIEYENGAFGLSSTNMLIHGDGNSNIVSDSMFNRADWIKNANINVVLMNPPYNATKKFCDTVYTKKWAANQKEDPSKGFHFVEWVARHVPSTCKIAVLLPMQAAIGNIGDVKDFKKKMLDNYTLDAVFSLPNEIFYPGASAVACCMIFDLSQKHEKANRDTFFGYYKEDNFTKRKGLGRVEKTNENGNSLWVKTEELWLDLYKNKREVPGLSVMHRVTWKDEWLAEAYMETNYNLLSASDFEKTLNNYFSNLIKGAKVYESDWAWMEKYIQSLHYNSNLGNTVPTLQTNKWENFRVGDLFDIRPTKGYKGLNKEDLDEEGVTPFVVNSAENNGIGGFSNLEPTERGGIITFSDTTEGNTFFYQPDDFIGFAHVQGMYPRHTRWSSYSLLFLTSILTFHNHWRYNYGRKMRRDKIMDTKILLPAKNGLPDWQFMEDYIKSLPYSTN